MECKSFSINFFCVFVVSNLNQIFFFYLFRLLQQREQFWNRTLPSMSACLWLWWLSWPSPSSEPSCCDFCGENTAATRPCTRSDHQVHKRERVEETKKINKSRETVSAPSMSLGRKDGERGEKETKQNKQTGAVSCGRLGREWTLSRDRSRLFLSPSLSLALSLSL